MPTYITYNSLGDDSIRIFLSDPIVVGLCAREDFPKLSEIQEVNNPGIYVLMDKEGRRYVGQSTVGVHGRLKAHDRAKDWWTDVVFIAHAYGALSPDKLNYLEAKLITDFFKLGYPMDNENEGLKNSYLSYSSRIEADHLLRVSCSLLLKLAGINLYSSHAIFLGAKILGQFISIGEDPFEEI